MKLQTAAMFQLPSWISEKLEGVEPVPTRDGRMEFTLELAQCNVSYETGGPFAASIWDLTNGSLVSVGVNLVVPASMAIAHAEVVAIALGGTTIGSFDLGSIGATELVTTTEPCAMCLGAVPWSGVSSLVCGARDADARAIGFDEGAKPSNWIETLTSGGISIATDVQRPAAVKILREYATGGGTMYNAATDAAG